MESGEDQYNVATLRGDVKLGTFSLFHGRRISREYNGVHCQFQSIENPSSIRTSFCYSTGA